MKTHQRQPKTERKASPRPGGGSLLTAAEVADQTGESEPTIQYLARTGVLPVIVLGHRLKRFRWSDVEAALAKRLVK
jgi:excisionase family DNA binding protein